MQMMAFGVVAPLKNPPPFSNTPRNDNHEEVLESLDLFYVYNLCFLAMFHILFADELIF